MKRISLIYIVLFVIVLASCKKSYLDQLPNDQISEKEVFTNINNTEAFVNNIYNSLPNFIYGMAGPLSSATDEGIQGVDWSLSTNDGNTFNKGAYTPSNFPFIGLWKEYYSRIRSCNIFLANYDLVPEDQNYPGRRERLKGEVLALKAYYYFELLRRWGGIPVFDETINPFDNPDDIYFKRNTIDEVVAFIVKNLDEASELLPIGYADRTNNWGRVSKMVSAAIKSRVLLYYASPLYNPNNDNRRWSEAAKASKVALDMANTNNYNLHNNYSDIFIQYFNQEVIWSRPMDNTIEGEVNPRGANGYAHSMPLQELVDDYEMQATGKLPKEEGSGFDPENPYVGRDPRFYASILYPGAVWKGRVLNPNGADAPNIGELSTNYWQRKGSVESVNLFNNTGFINRKWVLFRTSELYLNYAEAQNEALSAPDQSVYEAVDAIRLRTGVNMPKLQTGLSKQAMREKIRHERRIELVFERHRFWDVRRWKIAEIVDNGPVHKVVVSDGNYTYPVIQNRIFDASKHYWLPIPQQEIDKVQEKNPEFEQNAGWE